MQLSTVPRTAVAAGLPDRYRYWCGRSQRRYLFTRTSPDLLLDYEDAVVLAVRGGEVVWAGISGASLTTLRGQAGTCDLYVHLLAGSAEERVSIVSDLRAGGPALALAA